MLNLRWVCNNNLSYRFGLGQQCFELFDIVAKECFRARNTVMMLFAILSDSQALLSFL
jgi:hypothetical protein